MLSVHWLGTTLRFAAMTCTSVGKPENQRYSYTVSVTDLVSTKTVALLREAEASEPLIALRTDPHGRYLAIMPRAGGLQVCFPAPAAILLRLQCACLFWCRSDSTQYSTIEQHIKDSNRLQIAWAPRVEVH